MTKFKEYILRIVRTEFLDRFYKYKRGKMEDTLDFEAEKMTRVAINCEGKS